MKHILTILAVTAATALAACGEQGPPPPPPTAEQACADVGSTFQADSVERENEGGGEARCANNVEIENERSADPADPAWYSDEAAEYE